MSGYYSTDGGTTYLPMFVDPENPDIHTKDIPSWGSNTYLGLAIAGGGNPTATFAADFFQANMPDWSTTDVAVTAGSTLALPAGPWTLGGLSLNGSGTTLTLSGATNVSLANITAADTASVVGAAVVSLRSGDLTVPLGKTLTLGTPIVDVNGTTPTAINKSGSGKLVLTGANAYNGLTTVAAGTLQLGADAQSLVLTGIGCDIQGGKMLLDYSGSAPDVRPLLKASYDVGWTDGKFKIGGGRADASHGLGWGDDGLNDITIAYTFYGDATLDGYVDSDDLAKVLANYLQGPIVPGINATSYGSLDAQAIQMLTAAGFTVVPEPSTLALLAAGFAALAGWMIRRRK